MVSIGLSEAVSPASFKNYITSSVNTILQSYKDADMSELEAMEEIDDFIDFIGKVKVGPKSLTKTGQTVQKDLKSFHHLYCQLKVCFHQNLRLLYQWLSHQYNYLRLKHL